MAQLLTDADRRWPLDVPKMLELIPELREGRPAMVTRITDEMRSAYIHDPEHRGVVERVGAQSSIVAPLHVGDDVVGVLCLDFSGLSGRVFQPDDIALVESLGDRLVLVLERAYLTGDGDAGACPPRPAGRGERAAHGRSRHAGPVGGRRRRGPPDVR